MYLFCDLSINLYHLSFSVENLITMVIITVVLAFHKPTQAQRSEVYENNSAVHRKNPEIWTHKANGYISREATLQF